jgi:hypothetical protein
MNVNTISALKKELGTLAPGEVVAICLKLAKYKKESKELLNYLLFDANNEQEYIRNIKMEIDLQFSEINKGNMYFAKKSIRKILRTTARYIKYSSQKQTEVELLIHFCTQLRKSGIRFESVNSLSNLYANQVRKIQLAIAALHEDLQHDYLEELRTLNLLR